MIRVTNIMHVDGNTDNHYFVTITCNVHGCVSSHLMCITFPGFFPGNYCRVVGGPHVGLYGKVCVHVYTLLLAPR